MEKVLTWGVVAGILGAGGGYISSLMQQRKEEESNLGYDWPNIRRDPELVSVLYAIKNIVGNSPEAQEHYCAVGNGCENLLSLQSLLQNTTGRPQRVWTFKAWTYRRDVETAINALGNHYQKKQTKRESHQGTSTFAEYCEMADSLYKIVREYHFQLSRDLQALYLRPQAETEKPEAPPSAPSPDPNMSPFARQVALCGQQAAGVAQ